MKAHKTAKQAMEQKQSYKITMFKPITHKPTQIMRPGKTAKDRYRKLMRITKLP